MPPVEPSSTARQRSSPIPQSARLRAPQAPPTRRRLTQRSRTHRTPNGMRFRSKTNGNTPTLITPDCPSIPRLASEQFQSRPRRTLLNQVILLDGLPTVLPPTCRDHIRHSPRPWQRPQAPTNTEKEQLSGIPKIEANARPIGFTVQPRLHPRDTRGVPKTPVLHHF